MKKLLLLATIFLLHCGTPGKQVDPVTEDFAFLEIQLRG